MVFLTRHEESIKARPWIAFQNSFITIITILYNLWISLSIFLNFFFFFLCQKLSKVFWFPNLENKSVLYIFHSLLSLPKRIRQGLTTWILFVSLLPFPKERRTNRLNYFVSPFSLIKEFKTTQSKNSFNSSHSLIQKRSKV